MSVAWMGARGGIKGEALQVGSGGVCDEEGRWARARSCVSSEGAKELLQMWMHGEHRQALGVTGYDNQGQLRAHSPLNFMVCWRIART